jgi:hypothetical protein
MERKSYITRRFNQILSETINEKANELMDKLKFNPPGTSFDYVQEGKEMCNECGKPYTIMAEVVEGETCECGDPYSIEVKERLIGGQRKLDKNKNNKIDAEDFKLLRKHKKEMREYTMGDDKLEVVKPYGDMSTDSPNIKPGKKNEVKNVGFDYQKKVAKKFDDYELQEGTIYELEVSENFLKRMFGRKEKEEVTPNQEKNYDSPINAFGDYYDPTDWDYNTMMRRSDMEAMDNEFRKRKESPQPAENQPREKRSTMSPEAEKMDKDWGALGAVMGVDPREAQRLSDMMRGETNETIYELELDETETEEGNAFTGMLKKTKKGDSFELDGKKYTDRSSLEEKVEETYYRIKVDGEMATFSENEMIDIIESIVKEEKTNIKTSKQPAGYAEYARVHKADGKEEEKYFKDLAKKMTDYIKDGSKQKKFDTNPTQFPKGNGELAKMDKKAYEIDEEGKDFNYEVAGLNIPDYDGKGPDKETIENQIKGSSTNGNDQSYANAVNTGVNDKFAEYFENDQLATWKDESYGRVPSPVYGETPAKATKKDKKNKLKEEFSRIQTLMGYNQKTQ